MQIPIAFEFKSNQTFDSYFAGSNQEITSQLKAIADQGNEQQIYIWGEPGSGKSHLLQACCQLALQQGKTAFYFKFTQPLPATELLTGLEEFELVCFDDIDWLAGHADWELALFGFYNRHRQNNHKLLLAAKTPPKFLGLELNDLKTRMSWGLTLRLQKLSDHQLLEALQTKAHYLGFEISAIVGRFLLNHYVHELPALWQLLEKIDRATLSAQRKLTIPFLKKILAEQGLQI